MTVKYELVPKSSNLNRFKITVVADSNDADYITEIGYYTQADFEEIVDGLIDLKERASGRHQLKNYDNPFDLDIIPYNGWDGYCHTLKELTVEYIDEHGVVFDVNF